MYGQAPQFSEIVFLQTQAAYVSRSRVVLNGVTFPVNGITAVYTRKIPKSMVAIFFAVFCFLFGISCTVTGFAMRSEGAGGCAGVGIVELLAGAGLIAFYIGVQKDRYALVIGTAGREVNAVISQDWNYVAALVAAINNALASRA